MFHIVGRYNTAKVYANQTDSASYAQVLRMCNLEELKDSYICMMPDMHAAEGCTVGASMTFTDKVNPAYVGGDIGCGMQVFSLHDKEIDFEKLDAVIRSQIPSGARIHKNANPAIKRVSMDKLLCADHIQMAITERSLGTLGGGNHFIEVDRDLDGRLYLVIHSGSRRLGRDVANYYQNVAFFDENGISQKEVKQKKLRPQDIKNCRRPRGGCFLEGKSLEMYLNDMEIAVEYAKVNRLVMGEIIISALNLNVEDAFTTIHNYLDTTYGVLRKGAVSAQKGEQLIIPINMRDGSLICIGKGNKEWNCTAPHGSGRIMSRADAKNNVTLEEYRTAMQGVFSTSINESTLDESPMAYRPIEEILDTIEPTAEVINIITPVYNFKASIGPVDDETMDGED